MFHCQYLVIYPNTGLSIEVHTTVTTSISDRADPQITTNNRMKRGNYVVYTDKDHASIGRYASENGNERARRHFPKEFPILTESTIRILYLNKLREESKKGNPEIIRSSGRPPCMLELGDTFLKAISIKGGVVNIHVVRATSEALMSSRVIHHYCFIFI